MIRVLIVSQVRLISELIEAALGSEPDLEVVGYAATVEQALRQAARCDVMVVSTTLANEGALKLPQSLGQCKNAPRVVIVGVGDTEPLMLDYLEAGAVGCVRSQDSVDELLQTIRAAAQQEAALSPALAALVMRRVTDLAEICRRPTCQFDGALDRRALTSREREVLELIAQGYGNQEIAQQLTIELGTAKNHVHNILDKLKVTSRKDAVACWSLVTD